MDVDKNPRPALIIIGAARSGTKFLRDTLLAGENIRGIPYDVNFIWRLGQEACAHDALSVDACDEVLAERIRQQLRSAAGIDESTRNAILVEKTVSNCLRVDYVDRIFPDARYIHLVRDGRAVVESAYRQWTAKPDLLYALRKFLAVPLTNVTYQLRYASRLARKMFWQRDAIASWGPRYQGIDDDLRNLTLHEVCAIQWVRCVEKAAIALDRIPAERVLTTRYEDLTNGAGEIEKICRFIGIDRPETVLAEFARTVQAGHDEKWRSRLSPEQQESIQSLLGPYLTSYGYA